MNKIKTVPSSFTTLPRTLEGPRPLLRPTPEGRPYPVAALGPLRPAVEAVQGMTGAPMALPAQSALGVASLVVQGFADVETLGGFTPTSLYLLTIAKSGERKSTCDRLLMTALREQERRQTEAQRDDMAVFQNRQALWKVGHDAALREAGRAKGEKKASAQADLEATGPEPVAPPTQERLVTEPTFEGLTRLFATGQPSLGLFSDEGGQFLGGYGMSQENRQKTMAALNDLWGGNPIRRTRAGDGSTTLYGRRLALHLMVQPVVACGFMADSLATGLGFLPRVLVCEPPSTIGCRLSTTLRDDPAPLRAFEERMTTLLEQALPTMNDEGRELQPRQLPLSTEAKDLLVDFSDAVERRQAPDGDLAGVTGYASKAAEQAARIAAVLTLWTDPHAPDLKPQEMTWGIDLADYYLSEALRLAMAAVISEGTQRAEAIRVWLLERWEDDVVLPGDLLQRGPNALRESKTVAAAAAILVAHGWLVPLKAWTVVGGKPRKVAWKVIRG